MKKIISIILVLLVGFSFLPGTAAVAQKEEQLSKDPRLNPALENYKKGQKFMKKGHRDLRVRPGQAQKHFEYAESYFNNAMFEYRELGKSHGINTSNEVLTCKELSREAHVWISKARRKRKRSGGGY